MAPRHHRDSRSLRTVVATVAAALLAAAIVAPALAAPPGPSSIALPNGWAPEGITAGPGTTVFVGSLTAGGIWRGDVRTGQGAVIPGTEGTLGVGTRVRGGREPAVGRRWRQRPGPRLRRIERRAAPDVHVLAGRLPQRPRRDRRRGLRHRFVVRLARRDPDQRGWLARRPGRRVHAAARRRLQPRARVQPQRHRHGPRLADRRPVEHRQALPDRSLEWRRDRDRARHRGRRDQSATASRSTAGRSTSSRTRTTGSRCSRSGRGWPRRRSSGRSLARSTSRRRSPGSRAPPTWSTPVSTRRPRPTRRTRSPASGRSAAKLALVRDASPGNISGGAGVASPEYSRDSHRWPTPRRRAAGRRLPPGVFPRRASRTAVDFRRGATRRGA